MASLATSYLEMVKETRDLRFDFWEPSVGKRGNQYYNFVMHNDAEAFSHVTVQVLQLSLAITDIYHMLLTYTSSSAVAQKPRCRVEQVSRKVKDNIVQII